LTVPDNVVQNFWNWFGEGVKGWRCGLEKVYNTKWSSMGNSGENSEGQITDRKADMKLCYKVQMGTRGVLGTRLQAM
jgi:hypothetical protein